MKNGIRSELVYGRKSGLYLIICVLMLLLAGFAIYSNEKQCINDYNDLIRSKQSLYEGNEKEFEKDLKSSYKCSDNGSGIQSVENVAAYGYARVSQGMYASTPKYSMTTALELIFNFAGLIFTSMGILIANTGRKNGVNRFEVSRNGKGGVLLSKYLSAIPVCIIIILAIMFLSALIGVYCNYKLKSAIPSAYYDLSGFEYKALIPKIIFTVVISLFYTFVGLAIGDIVKHSSVCIIVVAILSFAVPIISKYELSNIINKLSDKYFEHYSLSLTTKKPLEVGTLSGILVLISAVVVFIVADFIVNSKRSAY